MNKNDETNSNFFSGEIDLREIILVIWEKKYLITFSTFIFSVIFIVYSLTIQNVYKAEAIYEIRSKDESSNSLSSLASRYGGIASLVGINFSQGGDDSFLVIEKLKSKSFAKHLSKIEGIKQNFFAVEKYDPINKTIEYDLDIYDPSKAEWTLIRDGKVHEPTALEFFDALNARLNVDVNTETGFLEISFFHRSPEFASDFIKTAIKEINRISKNQDKAKANFALEYLNDRLVKTPSKDVRESINELIKTQLRILMISDVNDNYLLEPIDPPYIPEEKYSPSRKLYAILGFLLGAFLGIFYTLFVHYYKKNK